MAGGIVVENEIRSIERLDRQLCHSSDAGAFAMAEKIHSAVLEKAGRAYSNGLDDVAKAYRDLADKLELEYVKPAGARLDEHIAREKVTRANR